MNNSFLLRLGLVVIMVMHSVPSFVNGSVIAFGSEYLANEGFGFLGVPIAILIKLIHLISIYTLLTNKYIRPTVILNALILVGGIIMIHWKEGWYVVGGGRNGMEFNFLLLICFFSLLIPQKNKL
ncbi:MAG: hypothetical protein QM535_14060 [Limnohabitans sp.]|nr:hypothetical protein [Limnohabitans sp.]